ncbi:MAG: hypothetical protein HGA38_03400 [Candidatus Moranbacteria bacterium]|nr:hypothetical protein [Candidatus Moranbacteria bacterium]
MKRNRRVKAETVTLQVFPSGSEFAHPMAVRDFIGDFCRRYGEELKSRYGKEIGFSLEEHVDKRRFPDERSMRIIMFPEGEFGYREHAYEVGALCQDVIERVGARDPLRIAVCEYLFYRGQERWFDAIEAASRALIEAKRLTMTGEQSVAAVRRIEMRALLRAIISKEKK